MKKLFLAASMGVLTAAAMSPANAGDKELQPHFTGFDGAFALLDVDNNTWTRYNETRCATRFSPCSTFKIPNSLIGLDSGVVKNVDEITKWDGVERTYKSWNKDLSMRKAFAESAVWYYQKLARDVGEPKMRSYVNQMGYGNQDISSGIDKFWIEGSLKISANEQAEFMRRLLKSDLPFSSSSIRDVRNIMRIDVGPGIEFGGKTGTAMTNGKRTLNWFVGYVHNGKKEYVFATNVSGGEIKDRHTAENITKSILKQLKVI